jgi:hypothetical protein
MNMRSLPLLAQIGRARLRAVHLLAAATLVFTVYNPALDTERGRSLLRFVVTPALVATGLAMWVLSDLRRRFGERRGGDDAQTHASSDDRPSGRRR